MSKIRLNGTSSGYTELAPPAAAGSNTITLPSSNGSANQFLKNGSTAGTLGWSSMVEDSGGNIGIGTSSISSGLSVAKYGSQLIPGANVYNVPAGRYHAHLGTAAAGQNLWVGFHGEYNAATGSVNLLLQPTFTDVSQQAGAYIGGEATSAGNTAITFGHLTGGATTSSNATKVERARITSGGSIFVGTLSTPSSTVAGVAIGAPGSNFWQSYNSGTTSYVQFVFGNANGIVGSIQTNGSATSYVTSSDYRLKENITAVTDGITRLQQLKPSRFNFKADPTKTVDGFIAHEVQSVVPEAITGEKDAVDEDGNPVYQGIDQSKLVPLLTAALQEALDKIASLEARITALEAA